MNLERGDLLQLDPISGRGTLKLLPLGKKNKQKLLIGDDSGLLSCYEFKKGEPQVVFQTKVFDGPISSIALGGNPLKRDKIFVAHSQRIVGLSKKGKEFFKLTSSLTETIETLAVEDTRIWTGCEFVYNLYDNGKDIAYYISKDRINDVLVARVTRDSDFDAVLGCQDSCIRIIHGSTPYCEIPTPSAVISMAFTEIEHDIKVTKSPTAVIFGMETGVIALVKVSPSGEYQLIWSIDDGEKKSPAVCINLFDINKDNATEIIVGRDDGRLEVYKQDTILSIPYKIFSKDIGETIRSVQCGYVNSSDFCEIIVATYSGKIISFTTEPVHNRAADDTYGRSVQTVNNENRIKFLRKEIDSLKIKLEKEREKAKKITTASSASSNAIANQIKPPPEFSVNSKFLHDPDLAAYVLTIELQSSIDLVMLRSPVVLELTSSVPYTTANSTSVLSITPPHLQNSTEGSSNDDTQGKFVAVFRCQSQEKRISLTLRTNEGEYGDLIVTVVAAINPKAAKIIRYDLKPLSLHSRIHTFEHEELIRPRNRVKYTGNLQLPVIHEWIRSIFRDIPPRLDEGTNQSEYKFRNTFTGAITSCEIKRNEILIESESASTIVIVKVRVHSKDRLVKTQSKCNNLKMEKENITRLANYRRVMLEESMATNENTIPSFLSLIRHRLEHQLSLTRKMQLVDAIQEISMQEATTQWLTSEYTEILKEQDIIRKEFQGRDKSLEYLSGIITDLYVDWNKLQGIDAKSKIPILQQIVMSGKYDDLIATFLGNKR